MGGTRIGEKRRQDTITLLATGLHHNKIASIVGISCASVSAIAQGAGMGRRPRKQPQGDAPEAQQVSERTEQSALPFDGKEQQPQGGTTTPRSLLMLAAIGSAFLDLAATAVGRLWPDEDETNAATTPQTN